MGIEQIRAYVYYTCAHQHIITHLTGCVSCAVRGAHTLDCVRPTERTLSMLNVFFFRPVKLTAADRFRVRWLGGLCIGRKLRSDQKQECAASSVLITLRV